jgi:hypothetical protein
MAQDRDQWPALVNMVMNLVVVQKAGISRPAEPLLACQGLCSMDLVTECFKCMVRTVLLVITLQTR